MFDSRIPKVGQRREASAAGDAQPRASRREISAREDSGVVGPPGCAAGRALVKFIAVGRQYTREFRVHLPDQENQAHGLITSAAPW